MKKPIEEIKIINPKPTDTIVIRFKKDITIDELKIWYEQIQSVFPKNNIVALPDNTHLEVCSRELWEDYIRTDDEYVKNF